MKSLNVSLLVTIVTVCVWPTSAKPIHQESLKPCTEESGNHRAMIDGYWGGPQVTLKHFAGTVMEQANKPATEFAFHADEIGHHQDTWNYTPGCEDLDSSPFYPACRKHSFGYQNGQYLEEQGYNCFQQMIKVSFDNALDYDLNEVCGGEKDQAHMQTCKEAAGKLFVDLAFGVKDLVIENE